MAIAGTLQYDTKLDTSGLDKGVKEVGNKAKGMGDVMKIALGNIIADLASVATEGLKEITLAGINYNATMESYQTSFRVMLGNAEKADAYLAKLKESAAKTPFELKDLAEASKVLLAFGVDADKSQEVLNRLGDISQGNAEKLNSLALVFGQVSSQGKLMGQDFLQLVNAGFPVQKLAEDAGMSMSQFKDAMSEGKITIDDLNKTLVNATSEGGMFFGSMEEQSKTFNGQMSTLKDNFNTFLGNAFKPLFDYVRDTAIPFLNDLFTNTEKYKDIIVLLGIAIGTVTALIIAYNIQQGLATAGLTLWGAICGFATGVTTALGVAFTFLTSPIGLVILAIGAVIAIGYLVIKNWDTIKQVASNVFSWLVGFFKDVGDKIGGFFSGMFDIGKNIVMGIWNGISNMGQWIKDKIFGFAKGITDSIKNFFGIKSPSTLMRDLIGKNLVLGIGVGIETNTNEALKSIDYMNQELQNKMQNAVMLETGKMSVSGTTGTVNQILTAKGLQEINVNVKAEVQEGTLFEANERISNVKNLQYAFGG